MAVQKLGAQDPSSAQRPMSGQPLSDKPQNKNTRNKNKQRPGPRANAQTPRSPHSTDRRATMEQHEQQDATRALEQQLRGMILSNVTIQSPQANHITHAPAHQHQHQHQQHRGRARGRGTFNNRDSPVNNTNPRGGHRQYYRSPKPTQLPHQPHQSHQASPQSYAHPQSGFPPSPGFHQMPPARVLQRSPHQHAPPSVPTQPGQAHPAHVTPQQHRPQAYPRPYQPRENPYAQIQHMDQLAAVEIPKVEVTKAELQEHETFREQLERTLQDAFDKGYTGDISNISLVAFGSLGSGFGLPGSDMDLAVVPVWKDATRADETGIDRSIPRLLEKAVLDAKMGGRLLTRTRVPILKVCQAPTDALYKALSEERAKWDGLSEEEKYPTTLPQTEPSAQPNTATDATSNTSTEKPAPVAAIITNSSPATPLKDELDTAKSPKSSPGSDKETVTPSKEQQPRTEKAWSREKVLGPLDFPPKGVGIQCDINFENPLGIHNTQMLRCYSLTDPRVRPIVLFVKSWAKRRKVNSSYSGTLSSYGWVLMVLHYLVNIAQPPVCPNLQHYIPKPTDVHALESYFQNTKQVGEYNVRFWCNEQEIIQAAQSGRLSQNRQTVGALLRGFFQYFASMPSGYGPRPPQFYWTTEVLSLRTPGGIRSKQEKGWVSAKTTITAERKVTNRYLFAIEDPFELDHNVARTVTHRGIVTIRDEFRRAWRILSAIGKGSEPEGGLFDEVVEDDVSPKPVLEGKPATPLSADMDGQAKVAPAVEGSKET